MSDFTNKFCAYVQNILRTGHMGILSFYPITNMFTNQTTGLVAATYDIGYIMDRALAHKGLYVHAQL